MAIAQDFIRMLRPCQSFSGYSQDAIFVNNKYLTDALEEVSKRQYSYAARIEQRRYSPDS